MEWSAGILTQSGGTNSIAGDLNLGYFYASSGSYNLGGGQLSAVNEWLGMEGTGAFTQTGGVNSLSGTLCMGYVSGVTGTYNLNGGTLNAALVSVGSGSGFLNFNGGVLSGGLTKVGGGQLTLSGVNGYTGGTTVSDGTLAIANGGALPSGTSLTVGAGGEVVFGSAAGSSGGTISRTVTQPTVDKIFDWTNGQYAIGAGGNTSNTALPGYCPTPFCWSVRPHDRHTARSRLRCAENLCLAASQQRLDVNHGVFERRGLRRDESAVCIARHLSLDAERGLSAELRFCRL